MRDKFEEYKAELFKAMDATPLLQTIDKQAEVLEITQQIDIISSSHFEENGEEWKDAWLYYARILSQEVSAIKQRGSIYRPSVIEHIQMSVTKQCGEWR